MNKNLIIGLVVTGVLVLGGIGWFVYSSNSDDGTSNTVQSLSTGDVASLMNPYDQPVTMTGTTSDSADPSSNATITMQFQDDNTWAMTLESDGGTTQIIYDNNFSYMQNPDDGTWLRLPAGDATDSPANDFRISDEEIADFRTNAVAVGQSNCSLGTCEVYEWTDPTTGEVATLKIGAGNRIAEVTSVSGTITTNIVFDYDAPVDVQVPTDYQEFNIPQ